MGLAHRNHLMPVQHIHLLYMMSHPTLFRERQQTAEDQQHRNGFASFLWRNLASLEALLQLMDQNRAADLIQVGKNRRGLIHDWIDRLFLAEIGSQLQKQFLNRDELRRT